MIYTAVLYGLMTAQAEEADRKRLAAMTDDQFYREMRSREVEALEKTARQGPPKVTIYNSIF